LRAARRLLLMPPMSRHIRLFLAAHLMLVAVAILGSV
jgi:hypothetical protein